MLKSVPHLFQPTRLKTSVILGLHPLECFQIYNANKLAVNTIDRSECCDQNIHCFQMAKTEGIPLIKESVSPNVAEQFICAIRPQFYWRICGSFNHLLTTSALQLKFTKKPVEKGFNAAWRGDDLEAD